MGIFEKLSEFDSSAKALLLSNVLVILLAVTQGWSLITLMWTYWLQSVIIGFFTVFKILLHSSDSSSKSIAPAKQLLSTGSKIFLAGFFIIHYGIFHLAYAGFLGSPFGVFGTLDAAGAMLGGVVFLMNHGFSFYKNYVQSNSGASKYKNIGQVFSEPYGRIYPIHLTIIFGTFLSILLPFGQKPAVLLFLLLKSVADLDAHQREYGRAPIFRFGRPLAGLKTQTKK